MARRITFAFVRSVAALGATLAAGLGLAAARGSAPPSAVTLPHPLLDAAIAPGAADEVAVLAGGCFWGVQGVFEHVKGVTGVTAGYAGGDVNTATYDQVSTSSTGHAESVRITFDPSQVSYGQILRVFFSVAHDPTQLNRQGPDAGPQYRSAIWYTTDEQKRVAQAYIDQLTRAKTFSRPIVTQLSPLRGFYPAEGYHQDYLVHHPHDMYIVINDLPKIEQLRRQLPELYRETPVLYAARTTTP